MTQAVTGSGGPQLLLEEWSAQLKTRTGLELNIRPVAPDDEPRLIEFFARVTPEDLRFRFLAGIGKVGHQLVQELVDVDHSRTENFLAFDASDGSLVATAMLAAEADLGRAEAAIAVRSDYRHRGVGWSLLGYLTDYGVARGIKRIEAVESRDNHDAIFLEQEMGFTARSHPDDGTLLLLTKELARPGGKM